VKTAKTLLLAARIFLSLGISGTIPPGEADGSRAGLSDAGTMRSGINHVAPSSPGSLMFVDLG
jgi:hypothetical protein